MNYLLQVMLASFLVGCTTMPTSNQELSDGYPFGSTRDFVEAALEADQFETYDVSANVIWYNQLIHGYMVSTGYVFDSDQRLASALWIVWDRSAAAFEALNEILANHFAVEFIDVSAAGITKFELSLDEGRVLHVRDPAKNSHTVSYYPTGSASYAIAWTQELDFTLTEPDVIQEHPAHGFGGFAFGASKEYVRSERSSEGRTVHHETADWLWYFGRVGGCHIDAGFEFRDNRLYSGVWSVINNDTCFDVIQYTLIDVYGRDFTMDIRGSTIRAEMEVPFTKIVHRKNDNYHSVSFYDKRS